MWCDEKWCMMWNVMWWATYKVLWCIFLFMEWWNVEWDVECVTAPCFATSHHHMVLWYGMAHDVVWCDVECNSTQCFATSHHHMVWDVVCFAIWNGHVECGVVWCGMCYNVTTPCFDTAHHHILHNTGTHFHIEPHHSSIIPHLFMLHSTDHALPHRTTTYCTLWDVVWCVIW